jgi:hypothetical protein
MCSSDGGVSGVGSAIHGRVCDGNAGRVQKLEGNTRGILVDNLDFSPVNILSVARRANETAM